MKKILILISILLLIASCGKSDEELLGLTPKDEEVMIEDNTVQDNPQSNTGSISRSGAIQEENKEEVKEEKKVTNNKELVMINNNVFLREAGKEDEVLTTRAKGYKSCEENNYNDFYSYKILKNKGSYGVVERTWNSCGGIGGLSYYIVNLNNPVSEKTVLTDVSSHIGTLTSSWYGNSDIEILDTALKVKRTNTNTVESIADEEMGVISQERLKKEGFVLNDEAWIKEIDFTKILPDAKTSKAETSLNLPEEYKYKALISEGYSLNNLGDIKEYYKTKQTEDVYHTDSYGDRVLEFAGKKCYRTIYTQLDKFLDFEICDKNGMNGVELLIYSNSPQDIFLHNDSMQNYLEYWDEGNFPIQPIFNKSAKAKVIITDLDTIKLVNSKKNISKVIWNR